MSVPNLRAIRDWCIERFQPKGSYAMNSDIPTKTSQLENDSNFKTGDAVTGIKGNSESEYRQGAVNLTAENVGALPVTGGTIENANADILTIKRKNANGSFLRYANIVNGLEHILGFIGLDADEAVPVFYNGDDLTEENKKKIAFKEDIITKEEIQKMIAGSSSPSSSSGGIGFINFNESLNVITETGNTWTATQNCWMIGYITSVSTTGSKISLDGMPVVQVQGTSSDPQGTSFCIPVKKGQPVETGRSGSYKIVFYGME